MALVTFRMFAGGNKIYGITVIKILHLVSRDLISFPFVLLSLGRNSSVKTNFQCWNQIIFNLNISAEKLDKLFKRVGIGR